MNKLNFIAGIHCFLLTLFVSIIGMVLGLLIYFGIGAI